MKPSHQPVKCKNCDHEFSRAWVLKKHKELNAQTCDQCSKTFCYEKDFYYHQKVHSEEVRMQCQICKAEFDFMKNLRAHERNHAQEVKKPFSCVYCHNLYQTALSGKGCERIHESIFKCEVILCHFNFTLVTILNFVQLTF